MSEGTSHRRSRFPSRTFFIVPLAEEYLRLSIRLEELTETLKSRRAGTARLAQRWMEYEGVDPLKGIGAVTS